MDDDITQGIKSALGEHTKGLGIDALRARLPNASDRQLRLRLGRLQEQGLVERLGKARATIYRSLNKTLADEPQETTVEHSVFSASSLQALSFLETPTSQRPVAPYDSDWFEELLRKPLFESSLLKHLTSLGRTGQEGQEAGTYARMIHERLLIDLSWASSALEGNTYTLLDTQRLIELGEYATGKDRLEAIMILNHKRAIEFLLEIAPDYGLVRQVVSNLHATLVENLLADKHLHGAIRPMPVRISSSTFIPIEIPSRIGQELERALALARSLEHPLEQSFFVLLALPYLQAFADGNKRVARLLANLPLMQANVVPLSFVELDRSDYLKATLLSYERKEVGPMRELFVWAYERSCARYAEHSLMLPEPDGFRMRHREHIIEVVREVVLERPRSPERFVDARARELFSERGDRAQFTSQVLTDLEALHSGNYMRYRIRESEFESWHAFQSE